MTSWVDAVAALRRRREVGVLVTLATVRGHAPRDAGAKMVVAETETWGSIGGGNLEATAVARSRRLIHDGSAAPELVTMSLSEHAPTEHGVQCCGGEVTVLLEPLAVPAAVAVVGLGHVGIELARILARHDLDLHLVDSRLAHTQAPALVDATRGAVAAVHLHHAPVPELVIGILPPGTHLLVMTHDHAEDLALCDMALRSGHLGSIGLIGSSAKWNRFRQRLAEEGHRDDALARIVTPIGRADIGGKDPATVALSVAADLVPTILGAPARASSSPAPRR